MHEYKYINGGKQTVHHAHSVKHIYAIKSKRRPIGKTAFEYQFTKNKFKLQDFLINNLNIEFSLKIMVIRKIVEK